MAVYDNAYSRLVALLKVILPLAALAILSTLFLVSQRHAPEARLPYSDVEVEEMLREQSIVAPQYTGVTSDGAAITISAATARPGGATGASADGLRVLIEASDGTVVRLAAAAARVDMEAKLAHLDAGVRIVTSTGYTLQSAAVVSALDVARVESRVPVAGTAPMGRLDAGEMLLRRDTAQPGAPYVLSFTGGVNLIYEPKPDQGGRP